MFEFKDDRIFLLSVEEYEKYKNLIPIICKWWWLRSPGDGGFDYAVSVNCYGDVKSRGNYVFDDCDAVRPALYFSFTSYDPGDKFIYCGITWVVLDKNLAIAEVPITFNRFDKNDNNYETSEVRQLLLEWYMHRKNFKEVLWETE